MRLRHEDRAKKIEGQHVRLTCWDTMGPQATADAGGVRGVGQVSRTRDRRSVRMVEQSRSGSKQDPKLQYSRARVRVRYGVRKRPLPPPKASRPRCGARTREGTPCQAPVVWDYKNRKPRNGRCRMHGGLSTGPKTAEGRQRSLACLRKGRRRSEPGDTVHGGIRDE